MYCENCGYKIKKNEKKCPDCGNILTNIEDEDEVVEDIKGTNTIEEQTDKYADLEQVNNHKIRTSYVFTKKRVIISLSVIILLSIAITMALR